MDIKVDSHTVVVFDLDDTLYNELDYLKSAYRSIAMSLEQDDWRPLYAKMLSWYRSQKNVFEILADAYGVQVPSLIAMYRDHQPDIQLFDGVLDMLKAIKSKNGKIGMVTDGRSHTQRAKIKCLGLMDYLDKIVISEEIGSEKPSLANFKAIEQALPGKTYYYIADNLGKDFIAPNALGWKSIALLDNGKNIHFGHYKNEDIGFQAHESILSFREIVVT